MTETLIADAADQYAVFGNPVSHSKSPQIHETFARQTHQRLTYRAVEAPVDGFEQAINAFRQRGGCGCNITVPFKGAAFALADRLDDEANLAGAVNTLKWDESGQLLGFNTDGKGLLRDLQLNLNIELSGRRILLIGAGGAAAGVLQPLLRATPDELVVTNRTPDRAERLAEKFLPGAEGRLRVAPLDRLGGNYDLVINATSAGLSGQMLYLPEGLFADHGWAYDLIYADQPTTFMRWAKDHGADHCSDGLGMLVEQAAEAFFIWRGVMPTSAEVIRALRG